MIPLGEIAARRNIARADAASLAADSVIADIWAELLKALKTDHGHTANYHRALRIIERLPGLVTATIHNAFRRIAVDTHRDTVRDVAKTAGVRKLRKAAVPEAVLLERRGRRARGVVSLGIGKRAQLTVDAPTLTDDAADLGKDELMDMLFPPLDLERVERFLAPLVKPAQWNGIGDHERKLPSTLAKLLADGISQGKDQREVAKDLLPYFDNNRVRARRSARTFGLVVAHQAQMEAWDGLGTAVVGYTLHATLDGNTRSWHRERDGQVYYKEPAAGQKGLKQMPRPPLEPEDSSERPAGTPRIAWHCLLPGNRVQGRFRRGFQAQYAGQAIELVSALGLSVRVTANHPVLTAKGWIPANCVQEGDYLACYKPCVEENANDEHDAPAMIQDVFGALEQFSRKVSRRPHAQDFHGDAARFQGKVQIVTPKRKLRLNCHAELFQSDYQTFLVGRGVQALRKTCLGATPLSFLWVGAVPAGVIGSEYLPSPNFWISDPTPFGLFRRGLIAKRYSAIDEATGEGDARHSDILGKLVQRFPSQVARAEFVKVADGQRGRDILGISTNTNLDAEFDEPSFESVALYSHLSTKAQERLASEITLDKIVDRKVFHYDGPVYDLETDVGYYVADSSGQDSNGNGILVANCRCYLTPVLDT